MLNEGEIGITIVIIPHNNPERFKTRIERDLLPTIAAHPHWKFQLVIIDNSDEDKMPPLGILDLRHLHYVYKRPGTNIMYGPAMNLAVQNSIYPYLVYVCSNHGHMYDPTWINDLIEPLIENTNVVMTGSRYPSGNPTWLGFPPTLPPYHIQGGIFGARRETLLRHPYTTNQHYIHWGSDVYECFELLSAVFELFNVPSINSVWRQNVSSPERWKYVHDDSE